MSTPATLNGQELEIFRIGDYGQKGTYTPADMQGIVARYSAAGETPIAIGHPRNDAEPAFGWLKSVRFDGTTLHAVPGDVHEVLDKGWNQKMYRNRSIAFAKDPKGQLYMHHLAFLGAVPPVVQGLRDAKFSSDPYEVIAFSDEGEDDMAEQDSKKTILDALREFFNLKENANPTFSAPTTSNTEEIVAAVTTAVRAEFSAELATEKAARVALETELASHKKQFSAGDAKSRVDLAIAGLKTAGAWVPAYDKVGVPALFSALAAQPEVIKFSDGTADQELNGVELLSGVLKAVGQIVPKGQMFSASAPTQQSAEMPAGNGAEVDPGSVTFSAMVQERSTTKGIPYTEAYRQLTAEGKRPVPGSSVAGAA